MEGNDQVKIVIDGKNYQSLEEVPEQFRDIVKTQIDTALKSIGPAQPGAVMNKNIEINIKTQPQPAMAQFPRPQSLEPSSSAWKIFVALGAAALLYAFFS